MFSGNIFLLLFSTVLVFCIFRFLSKTSFLQILLKHWRSFEEHFHVYQFYKIPQYNHHFQENQLFRKVSTYLASLPAVEDSDFTNLFSGPKSNDIILHLDAKQVIPDDFLSARVWWINQKSESSGHGTLVLKLRKKDKKRILKPYLQHVLSAVDEIEQRRKEIKLYMNTNLDRLNGRWSCVPFTHPATMDTVVMDGELKNKVKSDLESFLKSKQYYNRLGRVWKRSYLLYGPSGTGKSSFIAAMARFLNFDVYHVDISKISDDSDVNMLLLQTTSRSIIVIEDLDRFLREKSKSANLSAMLNFMDGIVSCYGEERIMVFTMNSKDETIDQAVMRPGRIDVHINFPLCDFSAFKNLANSYLGVKEHKLFPQVQEIFQAGGPSLSPAEMGELMIANRSSPTRALKSVISAMQTGNKVSPIMSKSRSVRSGDEGDEGEGGVLCRESVHTVREFRKLYGLLRMGSRRKEESLDLGSADHKEASRHGS